MCQQFYIWTDALMKSSMKAHLGLKRVEYTLKPWHWYLANDKLEKYRAAYERKKLGQIVAIKSRLQFVLKIK